MQPIVSVVGMGSSKHDFLGVASIRLRKIRLAENIKLLNKRYITNALAGNAESRDQSHVVEFGLHGVNLLNVFSPKQSLSGQERFSAVFFHKIFEKQFTCFILNSSDYWFFS